MPRYQVHFKGRKIGAIGITTWHDITVEAVDKVDAVQKCYDTHEHISNAGVSRIWEPDEIARSQGGES